MGTPRERPSAPNSPADRSHEAETDGLLGADALGALARRAPSQRTRIATVVAPSLLALTLLFTSRVLRSSLVGITAAAPVATAIAALCAVFGAFLLLGFARSTHDEALRWVAAATGVTGGALSVQAVLLSVGRAGTATPHSRAEALSLLCHAVTPLFALAGVRGLGRTTRHVATTLAGAAVPAITWSGTAPPRLVGADGHRTLSHRLLLAALVLVGIVAVMRWVHRCESRPTLAQSWVTVTLLLGVWDVCLHLVSGRPDSPASFAALAVRAAQYALLCAALAVSLVSLLEHLDRWAGRLGDAGNLLARLAHTDPLTGLLNRRGLDELGGPCAVTACGVLYLDLDGFKSVNDTLGHARGDEILVDVAGALRSSLRSTDLAARLGGDEFCVLLPGVDEDTCHAIARRVHRTVTAVSAVSVGVAWSAGPMALERLLLAGDHAMIEHKRRTRERHAAGRGTVLAPA